MPDRGAPAQPPGEIFGLAAFERNLRDAIQGLLNNHHSDVSSKAAAIALRILGTVDASKEADRLHPRKLGKGWRRVEDLCETDPFDPDSSRPLSLVNAINAVNSLKPEEVWSCFSMTREDHELGLVTPGLARFEPDAIVPVLRDIAKTIKVRSLLSLRQLSWRLKDISPLFDSNTFSSVLAGYTRLVRLPDLVAAADQSLVAGSVLLSLLPHLEAHEQLKIYLELPDEVADWFTFRDVFAPLNAAEIEAALSSAESSSNRLRRTLFFISAHPPALTDKSRSFLGRALEHDDPLVVTCASDIAYVARDEAIDELVISAARRRRFKLPDNMAFWRDRAVAAAVASLKRNGDTFLIAPRFFGFAANKLGGEFADRLEAQIDSTIEQLLGPIRVSEPKLGRLLREVGPTGEESYLRVEDHADENSEGLLGTLLTRAKRLSGPRQCIDEFAGRQQALSEEADAFVKNLEALGVPSLAHELDIAALKSLAVRNYEKAIAWTVLVLGERDKGRLSAIRNLALAIAEALSDSKPELTATLLIHVADLQSPIRILRGRARVPQEIATLFAGPDVEVLSSLRKKALASAGTDADLETLVFAAELAGHASWLQDWINSEVATNMPGRIARALMVEGLRNAAPRSSPLLARDWGTGFLGQVSEHARFAHDRNVWAKIWAERAANTSDPVAFWRFSDLAANIADVRAFHWLDPQIDTPLMQRFGSDCFRRIRDAAEKRTKKRAHTLFGLTKPNQAMTQLLTSSSRMTH